MTLAVCQAAGWQRRSGGPDDPVRALSGKFTRLSIPRLIYYVELSLCQPSKQPETQWKGEHFVVPPRDGRHLSDPARVAIG